ncbi:MAG: hypothetical protein ACRDJ1_09415 [Actinomycetota bacterium]
MERPAPQRAAEPVRRTAAASGARTATAAASVAAPERREVRKPEPAPQPAGDTPFVVIRKPAAPVAAAAAPPKAPEQPAAAPPAPPKPSRADRKAAEEARREAERLEKAKREEAARVREEQRKEEERRKAELKKEEERKRKDAAKETKKRERKHHRHSKRVNRRAAELDLRNGERVSLSIEGWSRFRRATLVVTNYRVALVTRMPPQVRWIPLEEVAGIRNGWRGAHSLTVVSPIEVLTLQKSKRQMLASFEELLSSEVAEARRPGATERHHGDITQEWAERSTEIWDSHFRRLRLWIRRHPAVTLGTLMVCAVAAFFLTSVFTSFFSPYR